MTARSCTDAPDRQVGIKRYYHKYVDDTFEAAEQVCVDWNMDLATFEDVDEYDAIYEIQCEHTRTIFRNFYIN